MRKLPVFLALAVVAALTGSAVAAPAARIVSIGSPAQRSVVGQIDGPATTLTGPHGRTVIVLAYRIARGIGIIYGPVVGIENRVDGISDNPDSADPIGVRSPTKLPAVSTSGGGGG
jgi:hypothetical protein